MSLSDNLQQILEETLNSFLVGEGSSSSSIPLDSSYGMLNGFTNDLSFNSTIRNVYQQLSTIPVLGLEPLQLVINPNISGLDSSDSRLEQDNESLPDLIPIEEPPVISNTNSNPSPTIAEQDSRRRLRLWSDLLLDYHTQMTHYQKNIQSILQITETMLPVTRSVSSRENQNWTNRLLQLLQNPNQNSFVLEFDPVILPSTSTSTNTPLRSRGFPSRNNNEGNHTRLSALQIQSQTSLFNYDSQNNPLTITICPITLEDFQEGEMLMRIHHCGHIFKAESLHRWLERNHKCPSCRYDLSTTSPNT